MICGSGLVLIDPFSIVSLDVEHTGAVGRLVGSAAVDASGWVRTRRVGWGRVLAMTAGSPLSMFLFGVVTTAVVAAVGRGVADRSRVAPSEADRALGGGVSFMVFDWEDGFSMEERCFVHDMSEGGE